MVDRCVCCGDIIPEGTHACLICMWEYSYNRGNSPYRYSDEEVIREADLIIKYNLSYREVGKLLKMPFTTVHYHMRCRLYDLDRNRYKQVHKIIRCHKN